MRFVTEAEVEASVTAAAAVTAVEASLRGAAAPEAATPVLAAARAAGRAQIATADGLVAVLAAAKGSAADGAVLTVFEPDGRPLATIEADWLCRLAAAAAVVAAVRRVAPRPPENAAVIGGGPLGTAVLRCLEDVLGIGVVTGGRRDAQRLTGQTALVVTAARARDPVIRDDWLEPGTLVAALGATMPGERELDYRTLVRASLVLCDASAEAQRRSDDLIETVAAGHLDWLEVHDLAEALRGELEELVRPADIVVYKAVGSAALVLAAAGPLLTSGP